MSSLRLTLPLLALVACASIPKPPAWYAEGPTCERRDADGGQTFCASALAATAEEARSAAYVQALSHAAARLSTQTQSSLAVDDSCVALSVDGKLDETCRSRIDRSIQASTRKLDFRNATVSRLLVAPEKGQQRAFIVVSLSAAEWVRLARQADDKLMVALDCRMGEAACPARIIDALTAALPACGLTASAGIVTGVASPTDAAAKGAEGGAARVLFLSLRSRLIGQEDGLSAVEGAGRWELIDTSDDRTVQAQGIPARRAVEGNPGAAAERALEGAVERLSMRSCGLSDASGSLCCLPRAN